MAEQERSYRVESLTVSLVQLVAIVCAIAGGFWAFRSLEQSFASKFTALHDRILAVETGLPSLSERWDRNQQLHWSSATERLNPGWKPADPYRDVPIPSSVILQVPRPDPLVWPGGG